MKIQTIEEYISLPLGKTFLRWDIPQTCTSSESTATPEASAYAMSPSSLPTLLMLHGATVPHWQFDALVPQLVERMSCDDDASITTPDHKNDSISGPFFPPHKILRIDLYGHGKSARPSHVAYNLDLFVDQVQRVLRKLRLLPGDDDGENPKRIIPPAIGLGHSMGSAILAKVAACSIDGDARSSLFRKILLVAPMLDYVALCPHARLLGIPVVGEALMNCVVVPKLKERRRKRYGACGREDLAERFVREVEGGGKNEGDGNRCGQGRGGEEKELSFQEMLLRMFRHGAVGDQSEAYNNLGEALRRLRWRHESTRKEEKRATEEDDRGVECVVGAAGVITQDTSDRNNSVEVHVLWGSHDTVANENQIVSILGMLEGRRRVKDGQRNHHHRHRQGDHLRDYQHLKSVAELTEWDRSYLEKECGVTYSRLEGLEHNLLLSHPEVCADFMVRFFGEVKKQNEP